MTGGGGLVAAAPVTSDDDPDDLPPTVSVTRHGLKLSLLPLFTSLVIVLARFFGIPVVSYGGH